MKYIFLVFFSTLVFGETYLTFQRNSIALVQNGFETIEVEATATNQAAYYPLYGNALDYSQNDNDGTVYGAVSTGTNYYFDGVDDYIDTGVYPNDGNVTFSYWWRYDSSKPDGVSGSNDGSNHRFYIGAYSSAKIWLGYGDAYASTWNYTFVNNEWYMMTLTADGTTAKCYVNGVYINELPYTWTGTSTEGIAVGSVGGSYNQKGYIKDVRIYDRALSATEVNKIYNATK